MKSRREFIRLLGGVTAAWPLTVRAQHRDRARRVGVLMPYASDDPEARARLAAFTQALQQLGWIETRNVLIDSRLGGYDGDSRRKHMMELLALAPDVMVTVGALTPIEMAKAGSVVPVVFAQSIDPVGSGAVASMARPGGNATGFMQFEYSLSGKWLELLKQIVPGLKRIAVLRDVGNAGGVGQWAIIQAGASASGAEAYPLNIRAAQETESAISEFAHFGNGGLIVTMSVPAARQRQMIIATAARQKLPAIYPERFFVRDGGLISYGPDIIHQWQQAARYVDRILKGEKPADLPVQAPTKFELVINLKTAKALGLELPPMLLARADEVIE